MSATRHNDKNAAERHERNQNIILDRAHGWHVEDLSEKYGVSTTYIYDLFKQRGALIGSDENYLSMVEGVKALAEKANRDKDFKGSTVITKMAFDLEERAAAKLGDKKKAEDFVQKLQSILEEAEEEDNA